MNKPTKKDSEKLYVIYKQRFQADCKKLLLLIAAAKSGTKEEKIEKRKKRDEMFASVMKSYKIPMRTLRTHLKKPMPGTRYKRSDANKEKVKLPKQTSKMVSELMAKGDLKGEAIKKVSKIIGKKISNHKALTIKTDVEITETSFGVDMKKLVGEIWKIDNIAPGAFIPITVINKGKQFTFELHFESIKDIQLILANEFNKSVEDRFKIIADKNQITEIMVRELFEEQIRIAKEKSDLKSVGALVNMQKKLKIRDTVITPDLQLAFEAARMFKPDLTMQEYIAALKLMARKESNGG